MSRSPIQTRARSARSLVLALATLAIVASALAPAGAATSCTIGPAELYCAEAVSDVSLDCVVSEASFTCDVVAAHRAAASTETQLPGELQNPVEIEVGVCNGAGLCDQPWYDAGTPCAWEIGDHGCATEGSFTRTLSEPLGGCLYVWVYQRVSAQARLPGVPANVASASDHEIADFDTFETCE